MTYFNQIKDTEIALPPLRHGGMCGEFKLEAFKGFEFPKGSGIIYEYPGSRRLLMDWTDNLIVNQGLNFYGLDTNPNAMAKCHVGSGNTAPVDGDTQLQTFIASAGFGDSNSTAQGSAPYYGVEENTYTFNPGFGGGPVNINEIAAAETDTVTSITARSLTVDGVGAPTTISVLADEYLQAFYRRRNYPGHLVEATGAPTDDTDIVTVQGIPYTYTIRPAMVTQGGSHASPSTHGWGTGPRFPLVPTFGFGNNTSRQALAGTSVAVLGAVTSTLSAFQSSPNHNSDSGVGSYSAGTFNREIWYQWGINNANDVGGIKGLFLKTSMGAYQMTFDIVIPKVFGEVFTFYHNFSWNRKNTWI